MELSFKEKKKLIIIDRTLPEIYKKNEKIKRLEIIYFCWVLDNIGVNFIEINRNILDKIRKLPSGIDFIYRVENEDELKMCKESGLSSIIIKKGLMSSINIDEIISGNFNITLEIEVNDIEDIFNEIKGEKFLIYKSIVRKVRFVGFNKVKDINWYEKIHRFMDSCKVDIDICPKNKYFLGTAMVLESVMAGINTITTSFLGLGDDGGFAPLEEALVSIKLLAKGDFRINLNSFQDLSQSYIKLSKSEIAEDKAIVGKKIFNYESGIHASGIEKFALTYEPYEPNLVGLKRNLKIGKHSGTSSVMKKLKELGLSCKKGREIDILLERVR
ncbi:MAG: citramalate synthase, partial [Clostridiales bacterium]